MVPHRGLPEEILKPLQQIVKEKGLWAGHLPKELGGMGMGFVSLGLLSEVIGQSPIGPYIFGSMAPDAGNGEILVHAANEEQKEKYLKPLANYEVRSCFAMTEPEVSGSDPRTLLGTAVQDGDEWVINAHKWYTTGAEGAAFTIAMVVTDPDADPHLEQACLLSKQIILVLKSSERYLLWVTITQAGTVKFVLMIAEFQQKICLVNVAKVLNWHNCV